ncbi:hypothetical protein HF324_18395 [Chitinophaga oryzae]|uniref:Uncharacterized protein n=1 Tax=Chitinophaga oryzae TaxID=2725414 RepID=A0ABX6LHW7_9BACT|nr:hypothetical protein [Chitinophaga oryzae]QJB39719.1 hypothetical protein HF324_18395 [Chitinophaga oryzae]
MQKQHAKLTTITEIADVPVTTRSDSVGFSGYMPADDTVCFSQQVTAGAVWLNTTVRPQRNSYGKTTGYTITSSATKAAEVLAAPVNRQIAIAETGKERQQTAVRNATMEKSATSYKSVFRLNVAGVITIVLALALYLIYRYLKKKQKNEERRD